MVLQDYSDYALYIRNVKALAAVERCWEGNGDQKNALYSALLEFFTHVSKVCWNWQCAGVYTYEYSTVQDMRLRFALTTVQVTQPSFSGESIRLNKRRLVSTPILFSKLVIGTRGLGPPMISIKFSRRRRVTLRLASTIALPGLARS